MIRHALCIQCMKLIVKYFFLADVLFLDKYIFPWQRCFVGGGGGHPRFKLS
jgi:hypothetical protein